MALKKDSLKKVNVIDQTGTSNESPVNEDGKVVDAVTGEEFPEAPKKRQGDGVLTGEVPSGFYGGDK